MIYNKKTLRRIKTKVWPFKYFQTTFFVIYQLRVSILKCGLSIFHLNLFFLIYQLTFSLVPLTELLTGIELGIKFLNCSHNSNSLTALIDLKPVNIKIGSGKLIYTRPFLLAIFITLLIFHLIGQWVHGRLPTYFDFSPMKNFMEKNKIKTKFDNVNYFLKILILVEYILRHYTMVHLL